MDYAKIIKDARKVALKAMKDCVPVPVQFVQADLDDKPIGKAYAVDKEGDCGGAYLKGITDQKFITWAIIKQGELWLRKESERKKSPYILSMLIKDYRGQSAERYEAYYTAFAKVLNENGITCRVHAYLT